MRFGSSSVINLRIGVEAAQLREAIDPRKPQPRDHHLPALRTEDDRLFLKCASLSKSSKSKVRGAARVHHLLVHGRVTKLERVWQPCLLVENS